MKKRMMLILAIVSLFGIGLVSAATGENASTIVGATGTYTGITGSAGQATADGGNVTQVDLYSNQSTTRWQGFYGNVTASLRLGLNNDIFYEFSAPSIIAVYASTSNAFDWADINLTNATDLDALNSVWSMGTNVDNATSTYNLANYTNSDFSGDTAGFDLEGGSFTSFVVDNSTVSSKNCFAFGASVAASGATAFDGNTWEYELMVPTNDGATETYYFYMSLA